MILDRSPDIYVSQLPRWIPTNETLPDIGQDVLIFGTWRKNASGMDVGYWYMRSNGKVMWSIAGANGGTIGETVTHWMPLPLPPVE